MLKQLPEEWARRLFELYFRGRAEGVKSDKKAMQETRKKVFLEVKDSIKKHRIGDLRNLTKIFE